ncbi:hypothetical protein PHET_03816 [Paragonimus heterotremus]|uniref:Serine palmitoyltransferase small subunit B n=1 Tax=Paragonimus heterotremus TaxID=100268 RepID=A0A8J4TII3_9TREM|nr:hypothetical protein PHET_03816 [Paragonimus heterotremus]
MLLYDLLKCPRQFFQQYNLCLAIYMCEPWEQIMMHTITFGVAGVLLYTAAAFIPNQTTSLVRFVSECFHS